MKKIIISVLLVTVLLFSFFTLQFAEFAKADPMPGLYLPAITIENDGTINPSTTLIQRVGEVYTFTNDIVNYVIVVHRENIVIDGSGYSMRTDYPTQGLWGGDYAFSISSKKSNITIKNVGIEGFSKGISFFDSTNNSIVGNCITKCTYPISFDSCSCSNISNNNITSNSGIGIWLGKSDNNTIAENLLEKNNVGISLSYSANNKIFRNNVTMNKDGIDLWVVSANFVYLNNFVDNNNQIYFLHPSKVQTVWDNGEAGNYWSNYNGTDANRDGVGENPFIIETEQTIKITMFHSQTFGVNQQDSFPLMELYAGQKIPLPTEVPNETNTIISTEAYALALALLSIFVLGLLVYKKRIAKDIA